MIYLKQKKENNFFWKKILFYFYIFFIFNITQVKFFVILIFYNYKTNIPIKNYFLLNKRSIINWV